MLGYDFDRQKPIDNYIIDFFCDELKLAIEIDGDTHRDKTDEDKTRQEKIEQYGIRFLRFTDLEVKKNIRNVLYTIMGWIEENTPPPPDRKGQSGGLDYNYLREP